MTSAEQIIMAVIAVLATLGASAIGYLYKLQGKMQVQMEQAMEKQLEGIRGSIHQLSQDITVDRRAASEARISMATTVGTLLTRQDFKDEMRDLRVGERRQPGASR